MLLCIFYLWIFLRTPSILQFVSLEQGVSFCVFQVSSLYYFNNRYHPHVSQIQKWWSNIKNLCSELTPSPPFSNLSPEKLWCNHPLLILYLPWAPVLLDGTVFCLLSTPHLSLFRVNQCFTKSMCLHNVILSSDRLPLKLLFSLLVDKGEKKYIQNNHHRNSNTILFTIVSLRELAMLSFRSVLSKHTHTSTSIPYVLKSNR